MKNIPQKLKRDNKIILFLAILNLSSFIPPLTFFGFLDGLLILLFLAIIASTNYQRYTHSKPINAETLSELKSFGQEEDGSFSDRAEFSIVPSKNRKGEVIEWHLMSFNEVDGSRHHIKRLQSLNDLKRIYEVLTNNELV